MSLFKEMQLDCANTERGEIIKLLSNMEVTHEYIRSRLRAYYNIK